MSHQIQEPIKFYAPARVYYNWKRREEKWIWKRCFQLWTHYLCKHQARTGFEPMTFAIPVQRSTNWANKPTGSWELVERCTGIAEVMGPNPIRAWTILRPYFHYFLSNAHNCEDRFHIRFFNRSSRIWFSCIYSREQKGFITPFNFPPVGGWKFPLKIVKTNCFMFLESLNLAP